jgi:hypothetical protein
MIIYNIMTNVKKLKKIYDSKKGSDLNVWSYGNGVNWIYRLYTLYNWGLGSFWFNWVFVF